MWSGRPKFTAARAGDVVGQLGHLVRDLLRWGSPSVTTLLAHGGSLDGDFLE